MNMDIRSLCPVCGGENLDVKTIINKKSAIL